MAVVGDNIANVSTIGFKEARSEFQDLVAGGQASGAIVGSGSAISSITPNFAQGTLEFTGRALDLAIDGNGLFVVQDGTERFYTRAGNFRIDPAGFVVTQGGDAVLGFPANGSGALETINVNSISQANVATDTVTISGNLDATATGVAPAAIPLVDYPNEGAGNTTTYAELNTAADFSTFVEVFDSLGESHTITFFFFRDSTATTTATWNVRGYVNASDVEISPSTPGEPRLLVDTSLSGNVSMTYSGDGSRSNAPLSTSQDITYSVSSWSNGASTQTIDVSFTPFTQFAAPSNILSITQDGQGVGSVTSLTIEEDGDIFAVLDNGQTSTIGTLGLVNFPNDEGLTRIGGNLLQQSPDSGEPVVGRPNTGTFGSINSGAVELSTVDIANEFVKLITLQRGFQANSRIITTIDQLLNEIIQLA